MLTYSGSSRMMLTSTPIMDGDTVNYVLTMVLDLTSLSELYDDLNSALESNQLLSSELEFYRGIMTSKSLVGESQAIQSLMKSV